MIYIGDANDPDTIRADATTFFNSEFPATDGDEVAAIKAAFPGPSTAGPPYTGPGPTFWPYFADIAGLVQVYDLVAPLDAELAETCLSRLGAIAGELLANRDDIRDFPPDAFRGRVMPAWGGPDAGKWHTDVGTSALFTYAMAAFARRVVQQPSLYAEHGGEAIRFITATLETYQAFRPDLRQVDAYEYFILPLSEDLSGNPIAYNLNLAMMQTLAEVAPAADSSLYRSSTQLTPEQLQMYIQLATEEGPRLIARNIAFRVANLRPQTLDDGTPYYAWDYVQGGGAEDMCHSQFELGCLAVIYDRQVRLNALLARAGYPERVALSPSMFVRFANTFLRIVWRHNVLSHLTDGSGNENYNGECAGWIPLSQFDPRVWTRSRDTTLVNQPRNLRADNHGALLRYRKFNSMKYLTEFAGQNWLITPAALAVGEPKPTSIHDQEWLLVLTGVVLADLKGDDSWNSQTVSFTPDMAGPDDPSATSGPLNWAINRYSIPKPPGSPGTDYLIRFSVEEWAPSVSLGAIFDQDQSINAGFAVNAWRPNTFGSGTDVVAGQPVNNLFAGINAELAVSDSDAWLHRLIYNITLLGKIVFIAPTPLL